MKKYNTVIFDLDGTLLDTLEDLADSVDYVMKQMGFPSRKLSEIRSFVGNGVQRLMELSVPNDQQNPRFEEAFNLFKMHYSKNSRNKTKPYSGIIEILKYLSANGYKLAIVSNKYYDAVNDLNKLYFQEYIRVAIGERENISKKPAPDTVLQALDELKSSKDEAVYIGDSEVDIETARNVGMDCISVSWGFRDKSWLEKFGANVIVDNPKDILKYV